MSCRTGLVIVLALAAGCDKVHEQQEAMKVGEPTASGTKASGPAGYVPVPETDLVVKLPAGVNAKPMNGGPGFANDDQSFKLIVREVEPSWGRTLEELKSSLMKHTIKDVLHEETTADGFILTFTTVKTDNVQDPDGRVLTKDVGVEYGLQMRFAIDGKPYKCAATVPKQESLQLVIDACKTVKKK